MYTYIKCEYIFSSLIQKFSILVLCVLACSSLEGQLRNLPQNKEPSFFEKADSLNRNRLVSSSIFSGLSYTGFSIGLYNAWYKNFDQEPFHLFDDRGEWRYMDKYGHFYTAYFQGVLVFKGSRWTGLKEDPSVLTGFLLGTIFQSTIEVMDGFSSKWGFSLADVGMNFAGSGAFVIQQKIWHEQRIHFKMSNVPRPYPNVSIQAENSSSVTSLQNRADVLYGTTFAERFLKDYNSQVYWACIDMRKFTSSSKFPKWLNIAVGYSAGNLFGGYENKWEEEANEYDIRSQYPRYSRFLLAPDINLTSIRTKNYLINSMLDIMDVFHVPLPAIEVNTLGEFHFHFFI